MRTIITSSLIATLFLISSLPVYVPQQDNEITEVSLERKGCNGFCPVDKVTFRRNGSHSYNGTQYVERIGNFQAEQREYEFGVLVKVLERVSYADLKEEYSPRTIDAHVVTLRITRGGKTKVVTSYHHPERSPIELVIISSYIENMVSKIRWKKVEP